jgi:AraC-like DNA-binding protein
MDPIEDVFSAMRIESALYARLEAKAPWGISFLNGPHIRFCLVLRGNCWLTAEGLEKPLELNENDCFIVRSDVRFALRDDLQSPVKSCTEIFGEGSGDTITFGGDGMPTDIVAGRFAFNITGGEPLISVLPPVVRADMGGTRAHLLHATLQLIKMETLEQGMGARLVVNRLADVLFMQAVRAHFNSCLKGTTGWIAGLSDRRLGAAICAMHGNLEKAWTVESLAASAGMSRSAFAQHFKGIVGIPPLDHLTNWRMYRARCLLGNSDLALTRIAERVGYETDGAFNRAFKRVVGMTPGEYRRRQSADKINQGHLA